MLMNLKEIQDPINKEMDEFKKKLKTSTEENPFPQGKSRDLVKSGS